MLCITKATPCTPPYPLQVYYANLGVVIISKQKTSNIYFIRLGQKVADRARDRAGVWATIAKWRQIMTRKPATRIDLSSKSKSKFKPAKKKLRGAKSGIGGRPGVGERLIPVNSYLENMFVQKKGDTPKGVPTPKDA